MRFTSTSMRGLRTEVVNLSARCVQHIEQMQRYLEIRVEMSDWHGVMDASADIRELLARKEVLEAVLAFLTEYEKRSDDRCPST